MPKTLGIDTKTKPLAPFGPIPPLTPHIGPLWREGERERERERDRDRVCEREWEKVEE